MCRADRRGRQLARGGRRRAALWHQFHDHLEAVPDAGDLRGDRRLVGLTGYCAGGGNRYTRPTIAWKGDDADGGRRRQRSCSRGARACRAGGRRAAISRRGARRRGLRDRDGTGGRGAGLERLRGLRLLADLREHGGLAAVRPGRQPARPGHRHRRRRRRAGAVRVRVPFTVGERQVGQLEVFEEDASGGEGFPPGRTVLPLVLMP